MEYYGAPSGGGGGSEMMMMMMMMMLMGCCCCAALVFFAVIQNQSLETSGGDDDTGGGDDDDGDGDSGDDTSTSGLEGKVYIVSSKCDKKDGKWHRLLSIRSDATNIPVMFCKREKNYSVWELKKKDTYYYTIQNSDTGRYLSSRGTSVGQATMESSLIGDGGRRSQWVIKKQKDSSSEYSILNRQTRQFLFIQNNVCDRFDPGLLRLEKLSADKDDAPSQARWKIGKAAKGWGKYISSSESC